jgi:hypothetical protein
MPGWAWVLIAISVAIVVLAIVAAKTATRRRTNRLRDRFGPEYERTVESSDSRRKAEAELASREERRNELDIRPLTSAARSRYLQAWEATQSQFVDDPSGAVVGADSLIRSVMSERGYPVADFEQRAADLSVDHPDVVENYRDGERFARAARDGDDPTENLRRAMQSFRALFETLVDPPADEPMRRSRDDIGATSLAPTDGEVETAEPRR